MYGSSPLEIPPFLPKKDVITSGIRSPMIIRYEIETPKHLMAIAASKRMARLGQVSLEMAKKEAWRPSVWAAALDKK